MLSLGCALSLPELPQFSFVLGLSERSDDHVDYVRCKDDTTYNEEVVSKHELSLLRLNKVSKND